MIDMENEMLSANDEFEVRARLFQNDTGYLAPGKDAPPGSYINEDERMAAYRVWIKCHGDFLDKTMRAIDALGII